MTQKSREQQRITCSTLTMNKVFFFLLTTHLFSCYYKAGHIMFVMDHIARANKCCYTDSMWKRLYDWVMPIDKNIDQAVFTFDTIMHFFKWSDCNFLAQRNKFTPSLFWTHLIYDSSKESGLIKEVMTYVRSVPPTHLSGCNELLPLGVAVSLGKEDRFNAFSLQAKTSVSTITSAADEVTLRCGLLSRHLETEQREGGSCNGLWPVQAVRVSHTSRWDWNIVHKHIKGWNVIAGTAGTHYLSNNKVSRGKNLCGYVSTFPTFQFSRWIRIRILFLLLIPMGNSVFCEILK